MDLEVKKDLIERVEAALDLIRPALEADGGNVELIDIDDDYIVKCAMVGHCGNCPMSQMTLQMGIERTVRQHVPEIQGVESVPPQAAPAF